MAVAARAQSDGGVTSTASGAPLESVPEWTHGRFKALLEDCRFSAAEIETIDRAYDLAKSAHFRFQRQGGDRYFEHCRAVALILIQEAGVRDANIIAAALLHDSVEDTSIFGSTAVNSVDGVREVARTRLTDFFNERVAEYVLSVTKFHKSGDTETDRAHKKEYYERMYDAPAGALLIKMADRLHNLRSRGSMSNTKKRRRCSYQSSLRQKRAATQRVTVPY